MAKKKTFTGFLPSNTSLYDNFRGTIQEILNKLSERKVRARQLLNYSDDGTNAKVSVAKH